MLRLASCRHVDAGRDGEKQQEKNKITKEHEVVKRKNEIRKIEKREARKVSKGPWFRHQM